MLPFCTTVLVAGPFDSGPGKFGRDTSTIGECDINIDSGRSGVDSTWRRRQTWRVRSTVDDRSPTLDRTRHLALYTARWSNRRYFAGRIYQARIYSTGAICCGFVADFFCNKLYNKRTTNRTSGIWALVLLNH